MELPMYVCFGWFYSGLDLTILGVHVVSNTHLIYVFLQVDDNVTKHIDTELSALDWDLMILHYLGLDHIGHTAGPRSPLVPPKLLEMDNIIKKIYTSLEKQVE